MTFIDSHSHIYLEEFAGDLPAVIERARSAGVSKILLPNIDSSTIGRMSDVCSAYAGYCYPMMGLHPTSVNSSYEDELRIVEKHLAASHDYIAIGETGMDLYWDKTFLNEQIAAFNRQIELALQYHLPIVVHSRNASDYIYNALFPYRNTPLKGVFHSFTGTQEEALRLLEFERFKIGINGVVTFKNSSLPQALQEIPLERILIETDAPYLTPVPNRGKRNESAYLGYTLHKVAAIYGKLPQEIAESTSNNTCEVFERLK